MNACLALADTTKQFSKLVVSVIVFIEHPRVPSIVPDAGEYTGEQNSPYTCEVYVLLERRWTRKYESVIPGNF